MRPSNWPPFHSAALVVLRYASRLCAMATIRSSAEQPEAPLEMRAELLVDRGNHLPRRVDGNYAFGS